MKMRKYLMVSRLAIREASAYRLNHFLSFLVVAAPLIAVLLLWDTVFAEQQELAGLTRSEVLTYFILTRWLFELTGPSVWWEITSDIRNGTLSAHLLRPESYHAYYLALIVGSKLPYGTVGFMVILPFAVLVGKAFIIPDSLFTWVSFPFSILLAILLGYQFTFLFSLTAFWLEEGRAIEILADIVVPFAMGNILPLSFLPPAISLFLGHLPFQYLLYFPLSLYLEQLTQAQVISGLLAQLEWIGALFLINKVIWRIGLRGFTAVGG